MERLTNTAIAAAAIIAVAAIAKRRQPDVFIVGSLPGGLNACTIPPFGIFLRRDRVGNSRLLQHELVHWQQYQEMGLLGFYFNYLDGAQQYGYDGHPMEKEARRAVGETRYTQDNYTECVRNGTALTIHDPNFRI